MQLSKRLSPTTRDYWRIVLTLAAKDIVDALRNKTTLTILLGLGMVILTVQALPLLLKFDTRPRVALYDADRSGVADELRRGGALQLSERRSAEEARIIALEASGPLLAVLLPAEWAGGTGAVKAEGYLAYWIQPETAARLVEAAEGALAGVIGRPVSIETRTVYPTLENRGHYVMLASGLVLVTVLITAILVPYLILEEKTTHTLAVLRVSPASVNQVLLGKGLAGMVYGLLAAAALLAFNLALVSQWALMLTTVVAIVAFGVGLGLLVGTLAENEGTVQMWVGLLSLVLMFPLLLGFVSSSQLPTWIERILAWLPTTAAFDLARLSFGQSPAAAEVWPRLAVLLAAVLLVGAVTSWRLRAWEA